LAGRAAGRRSRGPGGRPGLRHHHLLDAVIEEIDGRSIRVVQRWLIDFASCNYLGLDLDREVIEAIPAFLDRWGTHPSWSRMLGSPALYPRSRPG
jgi:8-amino-7-oxononanoate synthase